MRRDRQREDAYNRGFEGDRRLLGQSGEATGEALFGVPVSPEVAAIA